MAKLAAHSIEIDLPRGWDGRIYRHPGGDPILHAANFALPHEDGDFGSGATAQMPHGGAFLVLKEYRPGPRLVPGSGLFAARAITLPLEPRWFHPRALQVGRSGQAGLQQFFTSAGRPFCLYAVTKGPAGGPPVAVPAHDRDQADHLSRILTTLRIHRRG
jgi:hypothetical protein